MSLIPWKSAAPAKFRQVDLPTFVKMLNVYTQKISVQRKSLQDLVADCGGSFEMGRDSKGREYCSIKIPPRGDSRRQAAEGSSMVQWGPEHAARDGWDLSQAVKELPAQMQEAAGRQIMQMWAELKMLHDLKSGGGEVEFNVLDGDMTWKYVSPGAQQAP